MCDATYSRCTTDGCADPVYIKKRGLCRACYRRWHRANRPESYDAYDARGRQPKARDCRPPALPRKCAGCDGEVPARRKYCDECRVARKRERDSQRQPRMRSANCATCDATFTAHYCGGSGWRKYCTEQCRAEAARQRGERIRRVWPSCSVNFGTCSVCSVLFASRTSGAMYCGALCRELANNHSLESLHATLVCVECGVTWKRWERPGKWRYCSDECQRRRVGRISRATRRARLRAAWVESVDLRVVAERDGWRCHLCRKRVTEQNWSLDHLVPLSHGGEHSYVNVALAHHRCNTLRSNRGSAQLRLVG